MSKCEERLNAYLNPFWSNTEIMIVMNCGKTDASADKQKIVASGGVVKGHPQKVYRDIACKVLGIDLEREIKLCKLAMEV